MLVKVTIVAPAGSNPEDFPCSLEVIEDEVRVGQSVQTDSKYRLIILAAKRSKQLAPIGFIHGQRLSYTFSNPNEEGNQPVRVQAYIYDATGRLLTQTDPVELKPGDSYTSGNCWRQKYAPCMKARFEKKEAANWRFDAAPVQSDFSATSGSTRVARRAGM